MQNLNCVSLCCAAEQTESQIMQFVWLFCIYSLLVLTILALLFLDSYLFVSVFLIRSTLANQSNTTSCTTDGTGLPRDPRWWILSTTTVNAVDIANNTMVAPKYWAVEQHMLIHEHVPHDFTHFPIIPHIYVTELFGANIFSKLNQ